MSVKPSAPKRKIQTEGFGEQRLGKNICIYEEKGRNVTGEYTNMCSNELHNFSLNIHITFSNQGCGRLNMSHAWRRLTNVLKC